MIKQINIKVLTLTVLFVSLFAVSKVVAQVYPVQVNTSTAGPYHNYLSYYADENNHLQAIVTLTDFNSNPVQARLRITFSGPGYEAKTNPNIIVGNPFTLSPGVPVILNGIDFLPYFQQSNLLISPSGIDINNLSEGFTTICIDVIRDGTNQEILSTNNCTSFFLQKFQPPIPTLPNCSSSVDPSQMFYTFQWTPPVGYVPSIGADLTYTFSLYEWNDPNNYNIFQTGQGLVYTTQTTNSLVQLSNYDVVLQEGKDYVWRVEAVITKLGQQINMITNNGLSTPCTFTYGQSQTLEEALSDGLVINLNAEGKGEHKGRAYWTVTDNTPGQGLSTFNSYLVEYRKKPTGNENYTITWFKDTVQTLQHFIYQLEASTTYEVKVSGIVGTFVSTPSNTAEFTTFDTRVYACGEQDMPYLLPNYQPLALAEPDMIFNIGQFSMKVVEITPNGAAGHFSGKGLIPIQFLAGAKAKVSFDDILVDDQFNVRDGQVNVISRGLENWLHQQYMQFIDPIYVNGSVDSIYVANGSAWVIVDGDTLNFVFDPVDYPIIINDENGYQYTINPDGTVIVNTYIAFSDDYLEVGPDEMVTFAQNDNEVFGFDQKEHMAWYENYEAIEVSGNGDTATYYVANKSLGVNATDYVDVVFPNNTTGYTFKIDNGSTSPINGNTIQIPSFSSKGEHELYIQNANGERVGKLNLIVYEEKEKDLIIVTIANVTLSENDIKGIIDQTFLEANINVSVTVAPQWNDSIFTPNKNIALPGDVGLLNKYSNEMRELRDAYFNAHFEAEQSAYYIFVVPGFDNPEVDGYMVRGKSLGFVSSTAPLNTYPHELAHGIGALNHSWKDNGPNEGTTNNLMDYNEGTNLTKSQWKELRTINFAPSMFDEVEDASLSGNIVYYYKVKLNSNGTIASRSFWKKTNYVRLFKENNWTTPYYYNDDIDKATIVNYIFDGSGNLLNSYKYQNVIYYDYNWINNKWVRTISSSYHGGDYPGSSNSIVVSNYNFPVNYVYTVKKYFKNDELVAEKVYNYKGERVDLQKLAANVSEELSIHAQGAEFLAEFLSSNGVFDDYMYIGAYRKGAEGYEVLLMTYEKNLAGIPTTKISELTINVSYNLSRNDIHQLFKEYGLTQAYSYDYYLFTTGMSDTWERWANYHDHQWQQNPPFFATLIADVVMGVPGAVYGFATGQNWRTGEELTGWDHVFNAFEIIPVAGVIGKTFKNGVKGLKVYNKVSGVVFDVVKAAKNLNPKLFTKLGSLAEKGLHIASEIESEFYMVVNSTGEKIAKITDEGLEILKIYTGSSTPQWTVIIDDIPVKQGGAFITQEVKVSKYGSEIRVTSAVAGDIISQRKSFWDYWKNKCFPDNNWNNTTFQTSGINYNNFKNSNNTLNNEMKAMYNTESAANQYLPGIINSGSTTPISATVNQGEKLYKIVPKGANINTPSPFYLSQSEYNWIKANPTKLEQKLGLPLSSVSEEYDVFTITSKSNNNKFFKSTIAPTQQFANNTPNEIYTTTGGRTQSLIINNEDVNLWLKSNSPIETLSPTSLPQIE